MMLKFLFGGTLHLIRICFVVIMLGLPVLSWAKPGEALSRFIRTTLPKDAALYHNGSLDIPQTRVLEYIKWARPLRFFTPYKLIRVVYMDPTAGPPGIVLLDLRIAWTPKTEDFEVMDLKWAKAYRKAHPLNISTMSDVELKAYLLELVSLVRGADRWGFEVVKLTRNGYQIEVSFKTPRKMLQGDQVWEQTVHFTRTGVVESWKHLHRKFRRE